MKSFSEHPQVLFFNYIFVGIYGNTIASWRPLSVNLFWIEISNENLPSNRQRLMILILAIFVPRWLDQTRSTHSVILCSVYMRAHFSVNCSDCAITAFVWWRMQVRLFQPSQSFLEEFEVDSGKTTKCSHSYYFSPTPKNYIVLLSARISWRIEKFTKTRCRKFLGIYYTCHFLKAVDIIWLCEAVATLLPLLLYINMSKHAFVFTGQKWIIWCC